MGLYSRLFLGHRLGWRDRYAASLAMTRAHRPAELIRRTAKAFCALYEAERPGLTLPQFEVLTILKDGPQTGPKLVGMTGIDRATLYALLPRMQAAKMVWWESGVSDSQGPNPKVWTATADGRRAWKTAETAMWKAEKVMIGVLGLKERSAFLSALERTAFARPKA
jgi:DNA-binding MarR family transcriptional regulator